MVALDGVPGVLPLANWIWGENESETCLSELPFLSSPCFSQLLTKALGVAIIVGSCLNKVPIMVNMAKAKSAAGLSRNSLYGEAVVYANCAMYGYLSGHPVTSYGENISLLLQNVVLVVMVWNLSGSDRDDRSEKVKNREKATAVAGFSSFVFGVVKFLPETERYLLMSSTWPLQLYSKGSQINETYRVKHTGNLSIATTTLNLVGATIRVATTLKETGDMVVVSGYVLSLVLSLAMFVQYWTYLKNTLKIAEIQQTAASTKKED